MNVQRWLKSRRPSWEKLELLVGLIASKGCGSLSRQQLQEFGRLYRLASADLSRARALKLGQETQVYLNNLVVKAHNQVYQTRTNRLSDLGNFLWFGFPALVRRHILYVFLATLTFFVCLFGSFLYVQKDIHFAQLELVKGHPLISEDLWHTIEQHKMWTDPAEKMSPVISTLIAMNNIKAAVLAFVLGITFGFGSVFVLCQNGLFIGTVLGVCRVYSMDDKLLTFVAPHGIIELTSIFISGGAGLLLGKALLFPGQFGRIDALKLVAKDAVGLFLGCIPLLAIAGSIEGFISPRTDLDPNTKFAVSMATLIGLSFYLFFPRQKIVSPTNTNLR